ncbi:GNAT family N-acetyltransferase [Streptomyces sp. NRRL F-2664]|uniref:GNAT family N-acetyltransferase n=1 Tax=Streptomyces sp. NRRL F-2664 TaxID=1463842 RepID=UPI0004C48843|nr:GNAT family N-acetyltransferase [Streptomyces sp. NRRL F-2664]
MATEVAVLRSASAVGREEWNALVPAAQVYLSYDWLRAVEECFGFELVLFLLRDGGRTVAGVQGLLVRDPDAFPYHDPTGALFGDYERDHLRQALERDRSPEESAGAGALLDAVVRAEAGHTRAAGYPALVMTSPYGYACDVLTLPGTDREGAIGELLGAVDAFCRTEGIPSQSFLWESGGDADLHRALTAHGYLGFLSDLEYDLDTGSCASLEEYLETLDRKRRTVVRSEIRKFEEAGLRVERVTDPDRAVVARCAELSEGQQKKYGLPVDRDAMERLFTALLAAPALGPALYVVRGRDAEGARDGARPDVAGFLLCLEAGGVLHPKFLGFDAGTVGAGYAYFNLVFYHQIERAVAGGPRRIAYGMGSADAKRLRGCRPAPVRGWIRFSSPAAQRRIEPYVAVFDCLKKQLLGDQDGRVQR